MTLRPQESDLALLTSRSSNLSSQFDRMNRDMGTLTDRATSLLVNASDRSPVDHSVRMALETNAFLDRLAQGLDQSAATSTDSGRIERMLERATEIQDKLRPVDFTPSIQNSSIVLGNSKGVFLQSEAFTQPALDERTRVSSLKERTTRIRNALTEFDRIGTSARRTGVNVKQLSASAQGGIQEVNKFVSEIQVNERLILDKLAESDLEKENAKLASLSAEGLLADQEEQKRKLALSIGDVRGRKELLDTATPEAMESVRQAKLHVDGLMSQRRSMDNRFRSTKDRARYPLEAASAHEKLTDNIEAADRLARVIGEQQFPNGSEFQERSRSSRKESIKLRQDIARGLKPEFDIVNSRQRVTDQENAFSSHQTMYRTMMEDLDKLSLRDYSAAARAAREQAETYEATARETNSKMDDITARIKQAKEATDNATKRRAQYENEIRDGTNFLDQISAATLPEVTKVETSAQDYLIGWNAHAESLIAGMRSLEQRIAEARVAANKVKLTAQFFNTSSLQLAIPENIDRWNRLSFYMISEQPNGLLFFLGRPKTIPPGRRRRRGARSDTSNNSTSRALARSGRQSAPENNYFAVEIRLYELYLIENDETIKTGIRVADGFWHQIIVERARNKLRYVVRTEGQDDIVKTDTFAYPQRAMDKNTTYLFVGGIRYGYELPGTVQNRGLYGRIEDFMMDETPIGLWNFKWSDSVRPTDERDALVSLDSASGFKFDGRGHVILPKTASMDFTNEISVVMKFRSTFPDGLLFMVGNLQTDYFALDISSDMLRLTYNLGSGFSQIRSKYKVTDGMWHTLEANRIDKTAVLKIDGDEQGMTETIGIESSLQTSDEIWVGGYPGDHPFYEVTNVDFHGCIKDLQLGTEAVNLNRNKEAQGVVTRCDAPSLPPLVDPGEDEEESPPEPPFPEENSRLTSTIEGGIYFFETGGYASLLKEFRVGKDIKISIDVRPQTDTGIILAVFGMRDYLVLQLNNGILQFFVENGAGPIRVQVNAAILKDGGWHTLHAVKISNVITISIDEQSAELGFGTGGFSQTDTRSPLYIGGAPPQRRIINNMVRDNYLGCVRNLTFEDRSEVFDPASFDMFGKVDLNNCPLAA